MLQSAVAFDPAPASGAALATALAVAITETMFVAQMAFFNRVSDPTIGGTYMTMLNTITNLGNMWPKTLAFYLVDGFNQLADQPAKGQPTGWFDGYTFASLISLLLGVVWYAMMFRRIEAVQSRPAADWLSKHAP